MNPLKNPAKNPTMNQAKSPAMNPAKSPDCNATKNPAKNPAMNPAVSLISGLRFLIPGVAGFLTGIFFGNVIRLTPLSVLVSSILGAFLFIVLWKGYCSLLKKGDRKFLEQDALSFFPFLILALLPVQNLFTAVMGNQGAQLRGIFYGWLILVAVSLFIFLKALRFPIDVEGIEEKSDKPIYWIALAVTLIIAALSILKHISFFSTGYDLAIYDQAMWGYAHGKILDSIMGFPLLGGHIELILFILTPLYLIFQSPITLLAIQSIALGVSIIPLFFLAKKLLQNSTSAYLVVFAYIFLPSLQYPALFDFHPSALAVPLIFSSLLFLEKNRLLIASVLMASTALVKEHFSLLLVPFGIYLFFRHKKKALGIFLSLLGLSWFLLNIRVLIPYFYGSEYLFLGQNQTFSEAFESGFAALLGIFPLFGYLFSFSRLLLGILFFTPLAFGLFAFVGWEFLLLGISEIVLLFLRLPAPLPEIVYHHQVTAMPFVLVAALYGIKRFKGWLAKKKSFSVKAAFPLVKRAIPAACLLLLSTSFLAMVAYGPFSVLYGLRDFSPTSSYVKEGNALLKLIPPDASVAANNWLMPHLSRREKIFEVAHVVQDKEKRFSSGREAYPDFILLDVGKAFFDEKRSADKLKVQDIRSLILSGQYSVFQPSGSFILFRKAQDEKRSLCSLNVLYEKGYTALEQAIPKKELEELCQGSDGR